MEFVFERKKMQHIKGENKPQNVSIRKTALGKHHNQMLKLRSCRDGMGLFV